jgi:hypothetical protein
MLERAHADGQLQGWVTADEVYGQNPSFRAWLTTHRMPLVLATRSDDMLTSPDGHRRQAKTLAVPAGYSDGAAGWERRAIGPGAHGLREYDWIAVALDPIGLPDDWGHWLPPNCRPRPGRWQRGEPAGTAKPAKSCRRRRLDSVEITIRQPRIKDGSHPPAQISSKRSLATSSIWATKPSAGDAISSSFPKRCAYF